MTMPEWCGAPGMAMRDWEGKAVEEWRRAFDLPRLVVCRRTASTNDVARRLAEAGAPAGSVVVAEEQTAGRGRGGKPWHSPRGAGLLFSMVARPAGAGSGSAGFAVLPLRAGLAICAALESAAGLKTGLKWPNDVVYGSSRKLAGILCEAVLGTADPFVIIGIGINVAPVEGEAGASGAGASADEGSNADRYPPISLEEAIADARAAASERAASGAAEAEQTAMHVLLGASVSELGSLTNAAVTPLSASELEELSARDVLRNRRVRVDGASAGTAIGISPAGELLVEADDGVRRIRSGTVRPSRGARV